MLPFTIVLIGMTAVAAAPKEYYQSRYDHLDVENILNNRRMVNYYAACLLSKGPCPPQGVEFKRILPEALATNCAKCTEKQRFIAYRTIKRLKKEYPKIWDQLSVEWDPQDIYVRKFESSFENEQSSSTTATPILFNRFGEDADASNNAISSSTPPPSSISTTTSTTTTTNPTKSIKITNKPNSITQSTIFVTRPPQAPPFTTVGANLQATVSFGTNLVGGIVRSLGTIGTKVVESGTKLANMVISAAFRN